MSEIYTAAGLVKHAENALALKTKYMWGGLLRLIEKQYNALYDMYGTKAGTGYTPERWAELAGLKGKNVYGVDCVGLIKSYYWSGKPDGGTGSPHYGMKGYPDVNAGLMYSAAKAKGVISTLPERPGVIVYCRSHPHVGVYIGGGETIESTLGSRGDGVVKRKLDGLWEYWFECPYINYEKNKTAPSAVSDNSVKMLKTVFPVVIRSEPSSCSKQLGRYTAGTAVTIRTDTETKDTKSWYVYVRIDGETEAWIVKSALG